MDIFKKRDVQKRIDEANNIRSKYPDKLPIIVTKSRNTTINNIDKNKFLVPTDMTIGQFLVVIRKRIKLKNEETLYLLVNDETMIETSKVMSQIYDENKDEDGFLYITYCGENVFGF